MSYWPKIRRIGVEWFPTVALLVVTCCAVCVLVELIRAKNRPLTPIGKIETGEAPAPVIDVGDIGNVPMISSETKDSPEQAVMKVDAAGRLQIFQPPCGKPIVTFYADGRFEGDPIEGFRALAKSSRQRDAPPKKGLK